MWEKIEAIMLLIFFCDLVIRLVNNIHSIKSSSILHEGEKICTTK